MRLVRGIYRRTRTDGVTVYGIDYTDDRGVRHRERVGTTYRVALQALEARKRQIATHRFGLRALQGVTFAQFVEDQWRPEVLIHRKPSTQRGYETILRHHLLPYFGDWKLSAITRAEIRAFIAEASATPHQSRAKTPAAENPHRAVLTGKTVANMVGLLSAILDSAVTEYELLSVNPVRGMLRRSNFPQPTSHDRRPAVLEPADFVRAVEALDDWRPRRMVLFAALTGLRWGEQVALRIDEDCDFRAGVIRITRAFYRRVPQTPKSEQSVRDVPMSPLVRAILKHVPWTEGLVFSPDGTARIGEGSWLKRCWTQAQRDAQIRRPIRWHHLRHQFVSLMIHAGKDPLTISVQAGHSDSGFTLRRYGHLFKTITPRAVAWPEILLWDHPGAAAVSALASMDRGETDRALP